MATRQVIALIQEWFDSILERGNGSKGDKIMFIMTLTLDQFTLIIKEFGVFIHFLTFLLGTGIQSHI